MRGALVAASTALVILGVSILPFLTPVYVRFEQDRTGAPALTGYTPGQLDEVTGWLLGDLVLWQGNFDRTLDGAPVLQQPEIEHMLDVRRVFTGLFMLVGVSLAVLVAALMRTRGSGWRATDARATDAHPRDAHMPDAKAIVWRGIAGGARGLAVAIAVAGVAVVLAFDAAFELFHQLFFTRGTYTFDPRTDKLVQLFPYQFWSETAVAVGGVVLAVALATWWAARGRAARPTPAPAPPPAPGAPA